MSIAYNSEHRDADMNGQPPPTHPGPHPKVGVETRGGKGDSQMDHQLASLRSLPRMDEAMHGAGAGQMAPALHAP